MGMPVRASSVRFQRTARGSSRTSRTVEKLVGGAEVNFYRAVRVFTSLASQAS